MTNSNCRIELLTISFLSILMGYGMPGVAQIIPDDSLGAEGSIVTLKNFFSLSLTLCLIS